MPQLFNKLSAMRSHSLQAQIASDVVGLMNCATRGARLPIDPKSPAAGSVLNYGHPPLSPLESTCIDPELMASHIRAALLRFEPRIQGAGLRVLARSDTDRRSRGHLYFDVTGRLRSDGSPYHLRLALDYLGTSFSVAVN